MFKKQPRDIEIEIEISEKISALKSKRDRYAKIRKPSDVDRQIIDNLDDDIEFHRFLLGE